MSVIDTTSIKVAPFDPSTLTGFHLLTGDAMRLVAMTSAERSRAQVETLISQAKNLEAELHAMHPTDNHVTRGMVRDLSGCSAMWCAIAAIPKARQR